MTKRQSIIDLRHWAYEHARNADDKAHDMTDPSRNGDFNRTCAWVRAAAFYEVVKKIDKDLGVDFGDMPE